MKIWKEYKFDAAHYLPNVPDGHKCKRMHGHTYRIRVYITGDVIEPQGWVVDFGEVGVLIKPLIEKLDHRCLNEIEGLENPTSENLAKWIFEKSCDLLERSLRILDPTAQWIISAVEVSETGESGVIYED